MESFQDIEHFVKTLSAAIKKKIPTKVSQLTNDAGYKTTDTTYKLSKSGSTVTLTGSDGSTTSVTDDNTTYSSLKNPYSLDIQNNGTTVASYDGSTAITVNVTNATASSNGLMSASDKSKLDGIDPSAITTNAVNIKKNADAISAETTRAKKAEEANTQLTNDLKTGLTSGTVRVAKATVADSASSLGKVSTYQTWIPDNGGRRKYLLMYDITDWISAKSNAPTRGFDGYFISRRGSGFVSNNCTGTLSIVASYNGMSGSTPIKSDDSQSLRLRTTSEMYKPVILHNTSTNKYYLALETYGSVRDLALFGIFQGAFVGKWVQNVGQSSTPGTLPDGYELYSEGYVSIPYERAIADKNGKDITEYLVAAAYADGAFTFTRGDGGKTVLTIPDAVSNTVNSHIANKSNPHAVTKAQVGLGSVANLDQSKAIKSITRNGTTFTATALDGTTTTFTQQDSSTTYSVATSSADGLMSAADKTKLDGIDPSAITTNAVNIKKNADEIATYIAGQRNPDLLGKGAYIGRKIEGGGTIFFDYAIGFGGGVYVAPITENLHSYHVDPLTGVVMCDDPEDTTKQDRFMVVSDYDIGDYKHGNNLTWSNGTSGSLYTAIGTATEFGTGKANTEKCIAAATTDGLIGWNTNAYNCIWHYVSVGDWRRTTDRGTHVWFVPSKDELTVLLYMQWSIASERKSYDGKTQLIQLPINFYSSYWSSSEDGAMMVFQAYFCGGAMDTIDKSYAGGILVRLVRTF